MTHNFEAYMNGIRLTSLGGIYITDISHRPAQMEVSTTPLARTHGEHILESKWSRAQVVIEFILLGSTPMARQEKCQAIAAWAKEGTLITSDRPFQQLKCICTDPPKIDSAMDRAARLTMEFTAYEDPFWEDELPATVILSGTEASGTLFVPGNADSAAVEIEAAPVGGTLNDLSLTVNGSSIILENLGATALNPLKISYSHKLQKITVGEISALGKRTAASADDLIARCGIPNAISMTADTAAFVRFIVRGKWL